MKVFSLKAYVDRGCESQVNKEAAFRQRHGLVAFDQRYHLKALALNRAEDWQFLSRGLALSEGQTQSVLNGALKEGPSLPGAEKSLQLSLCQLWSEELLPPLLEKL